MIAGAIAPPMPRRVIDLTGQTFGRLSVVRYAGRHQPSRQAQWECACRCGTATVVVGRNLRAGLTTSCGCRQAETLSENRNRCGHKTHGKSKSKEYPVYRAMISRCENHNDTRYPRYGGRGIRVCKRWRNSFDAFLQDVGRRPPGLTIERIDNDGDYEPGNVRWATCLDQARNTTRNHNLTLDGTTQCLSQWAEETGIGAPTIRARLRAGWSVRNALTTPIRRRSS